MKRKIKFRGKVIGSNKWVYGSLVIRKDSFGKIYLISHCVSEYIYKEVEVDPKTVDQYIGLEDENHINIYENNIVSCWVSAPWDEEVPINIKGIIEFKHERWWFTTIGNGDYDGLYDLGGKVIGNIHDNPELLK